MYKSEKSCVCEQRLAKYTNNCTIRNGVSQITCDSNQHFWVGYDHQSHESTPAAHWTTVSRIKWYFLLMIQTNSVHTTGQASCVELVRKVIVWY